MKASEAENPDLFWGVRGGGGNFGVVTEFEFRLDPVGPIVLAGPIFWPIEESPKLLRFYRDWIAEAPDELMTIVIHRKAPPLDFVPPELHGELVVVVACCYAGPVEEGERGGAAAQGVRLAGARSVRAQALSRPIRRCSTRRFPHGWWYYMRACDVAELTDEVIDITVDHAMRIRSPLTGLPDLADGRRGRARGRGRDRLQRPRRRPHVQHQRDHRDADGFDEEREWARGFWSALEPHHTSVYVNFLMDEGEERVREAYGAEKYDRLKALKRRYDPDNLFRLNQNIPPG